MPPVNIRNVEFRTFAAETPYPFTATSTYTATNGRTLPFSVLLDIILYPFVELTSPVRISRIYATPDLTLEFRSSVLIGTCLLTDALEGGVIRASDHRIIGTVTSTPTGVAYMKGLAKHSTLSFNDTGLVIRPERILPRPDKKITVTVGGTDVVRLDTTLTALFNSSRFTATEDTVAFDNAVHFSKENELITGLSVPGSSVIDVDNRPVIIHCTPESNLQVIVKNNALMFHARGDN